MDKLSITLVGSHGAKYGYGHVSRLLAVYEKFAARCLDLDFRFVVHGDCLELSHHAKIDLINIGEDFRRIYDVVDLDNCSALICDIYPNVYLENEQFFNLFLSNIKAKKILIGIIPLKYDCVDLVWYPSFRKPIWGALPREKIVYGWDSYLLRESNSKLRWKYKKEVTIFTGGSDNAGLGENLPEILDKQLPFGTKIIWIQGPFAKNPKLPIKCEKKWEVIKNPKNIQEQIKNTSIAFTVYGVTLFELLRAGIPTVVLSIFPNRDYEEIAHLKKTKIVKVAKASGSVPALLNRMLKRTRATRKNKELSKLNIGNSFSRLAEFVIGEKR